MKNSFLKSFFGFTSIILIFVLFYPLVKSKTNFFRQGEVKGFRDLLALLPTPAPYPINQEKSVLPELTAKSVVVIDVGSQTILYQKFPNTKLLPASTTKVMTALIVLENYKLNDVLEVDRSVVDGSNIGLVGGEKMTVENLLKGLLIGSGNDAAEVFADNFPNGEVGFVWAMNQKAKELGLENTNFTNPVGLDEENHYSTAIDLANLTVYALKNETFSQIVSLSDSEIADVTGTIVHKLKNTNELVGKLEGVKGIKTGWTENAGECLIALTERNDRKILSVVLGSSDRFGETTTLINWVFENFSWSSIAPATY